ncbi:hypothetical protein A4U53_005350 (plasmid) [Rhizobium ruizarguesonis]|uniref:Uncharacterized protein n=1 Tax=Rhizobium ruizarguesonis TaxID=2081791 RepID=A0ACD5EIF7_9HYPH
MALTRCMRMILDLKVMQLRITSRVAGAKTLFYVGNVLGNSRVARYDSTAHDYVFDPSVRGTFDVIRDYSALDKIFISLNEAEYAGLNNTDFSAFSLQPAEYSFGGKDVYVASSNGVSLNAIYDTYYDTNLGETITVLIFFEAELKTPSLAFKWAVVYRWHQWR